MKLFLVDATFELFRAYYSRPPELGPDGRPVNAVRGLVDSMLALLREPDVSHVAAATDYVIESWRNDLYPGYKTSAGVPGDLLAQFRDAERALRALGIVTWPMIEDEADDAIASAVGRWAADPTLEQIVVCSVDKDLAQCVSGTHVVLRDRIRRTLYDEDGVVAKFGVRPASIPDYLALVGDASDGYPGLPGWGAKSAAVVLHRFGHLEQIPDDPLDWQLDVRNAVRLATVLREQRAQALLFRRLARLNLDVRLECELEDLRWRGVPRPEFEALAAQLGFGSVVDRVFRWVS